MLKNSQSTFLLYIIFPSQLLSPPLTIFFTTGRQSPLKENNTDFVLFTAVFSCGGKIPGIELSQQIFVE